MMVKEHITIGFEVLHYITVNQTQECVDSIRKYCKGYSYHIAIVDNASPNKSFSDLKNLYGKSEDITLIESKNNLGFARGNNLGYKYLKKQFNCDFIIMSNNDIELLDSSFIPKIINYYKEYKFAVLGPNIKNYEISSGKCNPMRCVPMSLREIKKSKLKLKMQYFLTKINVYEYIHKIKKNTVGLQKNKQLDIDYKKVHTNVQLHGCFLVFSRKFTDLREGLNPNTFLYFEENILYFEMLSQNLLTISVPDIEVFHKEKGATKAANKNTRTKDLFVLKNKCKSANVLYDVAKNYWMNK